MPLTDALDLKAWLSSGNRRTILLLALLLTGIFLMGRFLEIHEYLQAAQDWIAQFGVWGPVIYGLMYVSATLLLLPGTPFTVIAALLFGTLMGFVTMVTATTFASITAFLISRYAAKERFERRLRNQEKFRTLKAWVEENHWLAIPVIRVVPFFPFAVNNYALGLTRIGFWSYILFSEIVFIPMTAVLVLSASVLYRAMVQGEISWWLILGATGAGLAILLLGLLGKRTFLKQNEQPD
ncbi:MAG: TVP38/TMEM64 family protein [Desulfovibrionales bacterium]